ncbi:MAG: hemin receptor [Prevotella sp.]|nr:hemin receptor [Prevotella sp.]
MYMKKLLAIAMVAVCNMPLLAQETYEDTKLVDNDLNGTAKYVGMGGAMEALGADISTISTNPAGIGLFRKSQVLGSMGLLFQQDAKAFSPGHKVNVSFDQVGLVYSTQVSPTSFVNVGFNYHKSRNFDQLLNVDGKLDNASQNKLTYQKARNDVFKNVNDLTYTQVDALYMQNLLYDKDDDAYYNYPATSYLFNGAPRGYIGEYDFNVSGNINNRVFLGATFGIHDVHYKHYTEYSEKFEPNLDNIDGLTLCDDRKITGTGFDIKAGIIVRPVEESPFRIGAYVHTPTWYDLTTENLTSLTDGDVRVYSAYDNGKRPTTEIYDYKVYTPWKFGVSLGHTIGQQFAIGATYEYADYSKINNRIVDTDSYSYDWYYDTFYKKTHADNNMNDHTKHTLKGVSTVKVGAEYKPDPSLAIRLGYNYLSPMFDKWGSKDGSVHSPGVYYESQTNYTNWKATNRLTCGIGWALDKNVNLDVAYQYSAQKGDFYPFMNYYENGVSGAQSDEDNHCDAVEVSNKRHQLLLTIGYRF